MFDMFEWKAEYAVNIGSVDAQHQSLFAIGRELYTALSTAQGQAVLARVLERLVQYTARHFAHEERLMRLHKYPDFAKHKAEHDALAKQVLTFQTEFRDGRVTLALPLLHSSRAGWNTTSWSPMPRIRRVSITLRHFQTEFTEFYSLRVC
jgi:hemerythrin